MIGSKRPALPSNRKRPDVGVSRQPNIFIVVDLPDPLAPMMILVSPRGASLSARFDPRRVVIAGLSIMPVGILMMSFVGQFSPYPYIAVSLVVMACGSALALPSLSTGIVLSLPLDKAGIGSAVNDTTREVGGAVGIAVIGSILASQFKSGIEPALASAPPEIAEIARDGVSALSGFAKSAPDIPGLAELVGVAKGAFVDGMQLGLRVSAITVACVALAVWRWYPSGQLRPSGMDAAPSVEEVGQGSL